MIRRIFFAIAVLCGFWACKDDEAFFDVPVPQEGISFEPISGGAIMRYTLPENTDICAICARYRDAWGKEITVQGTPFTDTISLTGFHAPQTDVPVSITVTDNNDVESAPIQMTFNTLASAPYAFMDSVQVISSWNGVRLEYSYTGTASGIVDVYRVGINPFTKEIDTLYLSNFSITEGEVSTFMEVPTDSTRGDETIVVLKSEDGNGNFVRTKVFPGLTQFASVQYPQGQLTVSDPGGFSYEYEGDPDAGHGFATSFGIQYLLDGDTKGKRGMIGQEFLYRYYTYLTKADANGSYVQVELEEPQTIASVRLYGIIENLGDGGAWTLKATPYFNYNYTDRLPNHIRILGSNDPNLPMESWVELGEFFQPKEGSGDCWGEHETLNTDDPNAYDSLEPIYAEVVCEMSETEYKYLRVVSVDHFRTWTYVGDNVGDYISYHELEVYVKAE